MANFSLDSYETVEERIRRFYRDNPDARITTELVSVDGDTGRSRWVVKAFVFKDTDRDKPDSTGYAFEIDGAGMTQRAAALETCETSAIGRALANLNYSGNKRATREEMQKVQNHESQSSSADQTPPRDWKAEADELARLGNIDGLRELWKAAQSAGQVPVMDMISGHVNRLQGA